MFGTLRPKLHNPTLEDEERHVYIAYLCSLFCHLFCALLYLGETGISKKEKKVINGDSTNEQLKHMML